MITDSLSKATNKTLAAAVTVVGWVLLGIAVGLFTLTETYRSWIPVGLVLLGSFAVLWVVAAVFLSNAVRQALRSGLGLSAVLFLASAAVAVAISYDRPLALLQFGRAAAGVCLFYAVASSPVNLRRWLAAAFVLAAAGLALYWPVEHDFSADPAKIAVLQETGRWIQMHLPRFKLAALTGERIHSNVAAGVLLAAFPFSLALAWELGQGWGRLRGKWSPWLALAGLVPAGLILACLALTSSRGAFLGLFAMAVVAGLVWMQRHWFRNRRLSLFFWTAAILAGLALTVWAGWEISHRLALARQSGALQNPTDSFLGRLALLPYAVQLIRDYFLTGSGLRSFHMVFGVYSVMLDMVVDDHIHNTFLEIWIEQGLGGILALGLMVLWLLRRFSQTLQEQKPDPWVWAALAALFAAGIQGLVDVVFYVERTLPLVGFILGFATLAPVPGLSPVAFRRRMAAAPARRPIRQSIPLMSLALMSVLLIWIYSYHRQLVAVAYANLGAVRQTQIEMTAFTAPGQSNESLDTIRKRLDLSSAEAAFRRALAYDPYNLTAHQRLAQIYMSRGEYAAALDEMQVAWDAGSRDSLTRMLYGDARVAAGDSQAAADAVRGVTWGVPRLLGQAWYRYWSFNDFRRAADAWTAVLLIDPKNQFAAYWREQALHKIGP